jgi:hypothetical protein
VIGRSNTARNPRLFFMSDGLASMMIGLCAMSAPIWTLAYRADVWANAAEPHYLSKVSILACEERKIVVPLCNMENQSFGSVAPTWHLLHVTLQCSYTATPRPPRRSSAPMYVSQARLEHETSLCLSQEMQRGEWVKLKAVASCSPKPAWHSRLR